METEGLRVPLGDRKKFILRAVVDNYITTAEPVASKTLAEEFGGRYSSATLRNEMNELESLGFLDKPHTSAGRVPSAKGYRMYVDELMRVGELTLSEAEHIDRALSGRLRELDRLISETGQVLSRLTSYAVYAGTVRRDGARLKRVDIVILDLDSCIIVAAFSANMVKNLVTARPKGVEGDRIARLVEALNRHLSGRLASELSAVAAIEAAKESGTPPEFAAFVVDYLRTAAQSLEERDVSLDGAARILSQPEYRDIGKAQELLEYLSDVSARKALPTPEADGAVKILIGPENIVHELRDSSVVAASYDLGDGVRGVIGVLGPTRMDYSKVAARLGYFASRLGNLLGEADKGET